MVVLLACAGNGVQGAVSDTDFDRGGECCELLEGVDIACVHICSPCTFVECLDMMRYGQGCGRGVMLVVHVCVECLS